MTPEEAEAIRRRSDAAFRGETAPPPRPPRAGEEAAGRPDAGEKPAWARLVPDPRFPEDLYLSAFASARVEGDLADAKHRADERARAELAKAIRVHVEGTFADFLRETRQTGDASPRQVSDLAQRTMSRVAMDLEGVRIAERYHDAAEGHVYALAVLDRALAARLADERLASLARELDAAAAAGREALAKGGDEAFFQLSRARRLAAEYALRRAERTVVAPSAPLPPPPAADAAAISADWDRARRGLLFLVRGFGRATGGADLRTDPVDAAVLAVLRERGIPVSAARAGGEPGYEALKADPAAVRRGGGEGRYLLLYRVEADARPLALGDRRAFVCKSRLDVSLFDAAEGRLLAAESIDPGDETKVFRPDAAEAARESAAKLADVARGRVASVVDALFLYVGGVGR